MTNAKDWIGVEAKGVDLDKQGLGRYLVDLRGGTADDPVRLPVIVAKGGEGPVVLVAGGTHGDEFEGQIVVSDLARTLDPASLQGTIIAVPLHNAPACQAGSRRAPSDGIDLNRLYGVAQAPPSPGAAIARFVSDVLLPPTDWVIDLHSGGDAHEFVLSANLQAAADSQEFHDMLPALLAFEAPYAIVFDEAEAGPLGMPHAGTLEGFARHMGKRALSSELGGGGRATPASLAAARRGLSNLLAHIGVCARRDRTPPQPRPSRLVVLSRPEHHVAAPVAGRLAPHVWLEDEVRRGDRLGFIHPIEDPLAPPFELVSQTDGIVVAAPSRGLQRRGQAVFFIAEPIARADA